MNGEHVNHLGPSLSTIMVYADTYTLKIRLDGIHLYMDTFQDKVQLYKINVSYGSKFIAQAPHGQVF